LHISPQEDERRAAEALQAGLARQYGAAPSDVLVVRSPYRLCPLGAHVDHQGGRVSGFALEESTLLAFAPGKGDRVRLSSLDFPGEASFHLADIPAAEAGSWGNYARGAALALRRKHGIARGMDGIVRGALPMGGVGSSAAVGVAYLLALEKVNGLDLPPEENIQLDNFVENAYVGLQNGILDQSVVLLARKDELLCMDCSTRAYESVKFGGDPGRLGILIVHSGIPRVLVSTDYNKHVGECREAAADLLRAAGIPVPESPRLGHVPAGAFEAHGGRLPAHLFRRAKHYFEETARVGKGAEAWARGDLAAFGELMKESGWSSIHNYRCGCPELIQLHEILASLEGVHGTRFSGAGYGGCAIALVKPELAEPIAAAVTERYLSAHPKARGAFRIFFSRAAGGACFL
jgi:galactokinase